MWMRQRFCSNKWTLDSICENFLYFHRTGIQTCKALAEETVVLLVEMLPVHVTGALFICSWHTSKRKPALLCFTTSNNSKNNTIVSMPLDASIHFQFRFQQLVYRGIDIRHVFVCTCARARTRAVPWCVVFYACYLYTSTRQYMQHWHYQQTTSSSS